MSPSGPTLLQLTPRKSGGLLADMPLVVWIGLAGVAAACKVVDSNDGTAGLLFDALLLGALFVWLLLRLLGGGAICPQRTLSLLAGVALLAWYVGRIVGHPIDLAVRNHVGNLFDNVLPGVAFGAVAAHSVGRYIRALKSGDSSRWDRSIPVALWAMAIAVALLCVWLAGRTGDDILLVTAELLEGADLYQVLGDALIVGILASYGVASVWWVQRREDWIGRMSLVTLGIAALGTSVLLGSNKLLLVAACLLGVLAWRTISERPGYAFLLLVAAALPVASWSISDDGLKGQLGDLLLLTRLLDYGNVDSIWDTPSIAARVQLVVECGSAQLSRAPLIGDLAAELMTCGPGEYIHSLASIQSHLGIVGSALAMLAIGRAVWVIGRTPHNRALRGVFFILLAVALLSAFFTWMPFWFALSWALCLPTESVQVSRAASASRRQALC